MSSIHTGNMKKHLASLTTPQLKKELKKVSKEYQGSQISFMHEASYQSWQLHITLIEEELKSRG